MVVIEQKNCVLSILFNCAFIDDYVFIVLYPIPWGHDSVQAYNTCDLRPTLHSTLHAKHEC